MLQRIHCLVIFPTCIDEVRANKYAQVFSCFRSLVFSFFCLWMPNCSRFYVMYCVNIRSKLYFHVPFRKLENVEQFIHFTYKSLIPNLLLFSVDTENCVSVWSFSYDSIPSDTPDSNNVEACQSLLQQVSMTKLLTPLNSCLIPTILLKLHPNGEASHISGTRAL